MTRFLLAALCALMISGCSQTQTPDEEAVLLTASAPTHQITFKNQCHESVWVGSVGGCGGDTVVSRRTGPRSDTGSWEWVASLRPFNFIHNVCCTIRLLYVLYLWIPFLAPLEPYRYHNATCPWIPYRPWKPFLPIVFDSTCPLLPAHRRSSR